MTVGISSGYPAQYGKTSDGVPVFCQGLGRWIPLAKAEDIPTQTSDLTNDSGFLTAHQDITGKVDKTQMIAGIDLQDDITAAELKTALSVPVKISDLDSAAIMGQGFVRLYKANFDETPSNVSGSYYDPEFRLYDIIYYPKVGAFYQCTSFSKYVTTYNETRYSYQITKINLKTSQLNNDAGFLTQHQDISGKEDKANKVSSVTNSSSTTDYPSVAAMSAYVRSQGFLTQHQDISGKMNLAAALVQTNAFGTAPDTTDPVFTALPSNQIFQCYIAGNLTYWMKYAGTAYRIALYDDLPTSTSDLINDSGYIDKANVFFECTVVQDTESADAVFNVLSSNLSLDLIASLIEDGVVSIWCRVNLLGTYTAVLFPLTVINKSSNNKFSAVMFGGVIDATQMNMGVLYVSLFVNSQGTSATVRKLFAEET